MSLTPKRKMTAKSLAAHRRNARRSRGAVTSSGKARAARANLRHGFYSQAQNDVMVALGEDPAEYTRLMDSVVESLDPSDGLEAAVARRLGRALWRLERADRMQDGLAVKRVRSGMELAQVTAAPRVVQVQHLYERLCNIACLLNREGPAPAPGEIDALIAAFGENPPAEVQTILPLLRAYGEAVEKASGPPDPAGHAPAIPSANGDAELQSAERRLRLPLEAIIMRFAALRETLTAAYDQAQSAENRAALMAPQNEKALIMQRLEDANLRQLWRLTDLFIKIRKGKLLEERL